MAGAISEFLDADAGFIENRYQQIRHGSGFGINQVLTRLKVASEAPGEQAWKIRVAVQIAIPHSTAV